MVTTLAKSVSSSSIVTVGSWVSVISSPTSEADSNPSMFSRTVVLSKVVTLMSVTLQSGAHGWISPPEQSSTCAMNTGMNAPPRQQTEMH